MDVTDAPTAASAAGGFPSRLGPCALLRPLGSGAMGSVYLAEMREDRPYALSGQRVAVKVLHPERLASAGAFKRFLREADLGRSLAHHGIVRTFDADAATEDGRLYHFLVLEYVEGQTLRELMAALGALPEPLLRDLALQVARALAAVHQAGAVHRDVKPANVLVTPDHQVKLFDLGLARLSDDSAALTAPDLFVGTLRYASPEQVQGRPVGPPADLFALGTVLYEGATGVQPFAAQGGPQALMWRLLEHSPARVRALNPAITPFLEEVIAALLEKDPARRFADAGELAPVLAEAEESPWWRGRRQSSRHPEPDALLGHLRVRRDAALVGRSPELSQLESLLTEARAERGSFVWLEGEAGVGKTRLVDAFARSAAAAGARALYGSHAPGIGGSRGALGEAVVAHLGEAGLDTALARLLPGMSRLVPAFAASLRGEALPAGAEPLTAEATQALYCGLAAALARGRSVVWIVDDVHLASRDSRALLLSLARTVEDLGLLLVATSRPGVAADEAAEWERLRRIRRLHVGRLGAREVVELLRELLGSESLARQIGGGVALRSDGNPFFVVEMVRELRARGAIRRENDGSWSVTGDALALETPSSIRGLVEARLREVSEEERHLLDVGAVEGYDFDADLVARALDRKRLGVLQALAALERRTGLVRAAGARFRFDYHQVQEVLHAALPEALRAEYHALIAEGYEEREGLRARPPEEIPGRAAAFLATHFLKGGRSEAARRLVVRALDHLDLERRSEQVAALAEAAVAALAGEDPALGCELRLRQQRCLELLGRREEALVVGVEAASSAAALGDTVRQARAAFGSAAVLYGLGRYQDAESRLEEALGLARSGGDADTEAGVLLKQADLLLRRGEQAGAAGRAEASLAAARRAGATRAEVEALRFIGFLRMLERRHDEARAVLGECLAIAGRAGDRLLEAGSLFYLGLVDKSLGLWVPACRRVEAALAVAEEIGARGFQATALGALGSIHGEMALVGQGRREMEAALDLMRVIGASDDAILRSLLGHTLLLEGRTEEAETHLLRALALHDSIGTSRGRRLALAGMGEVARARREYAKASEWFERLLAEERRRGWPAPGTHIARAAVLAEAGDREGARAVLASAEGELEERDREDVPWRAWTAWLLGREAAGLAVPETLSAAGRAEAHLALHRAGVDGHLAKARALLEALSSHLRGSDLAGFWRFNVTARSVLEEESGGGPPTASGA